MRKIGEGAEAIIFETQIMGIPAILKERQEKSYRVRQLDGKIRSQRTKTEARLIAKAAASGINVPKILHIGRYRIYMSRIHANNLNTLKSPPDHVYVESGAQLAALHKSDIVHGDFTTANIMVGKSGSVWIIDFGLSEFTNSIEEKALDVLLMKRSVNKKHYSLFLKGYGKLDYAEDVLARVSEIEKRGRYQTRTLTTAKES